MKSSPRLDAIWYEILRLTNASSAMRTALEPTVIGGKLMKPGYKIMSPFRQLHFDKSIFGATADRFDPDRFLKDKELSNHPSYKPFGGGMTMCPGRFVARQEVYIFVTLILHRFESRLTTTDQPMPRFELNTPTTGIISPVIGDDVHLVLQAK